MTTPPVDTGESPTLAPDPDASELREEFARACSEALIAWTQAEPWQRRAIGAIAPRLARGFYLADLTMDAMIGSDEHEVDLDELRTALAGLPDPVDLMRRARWCTGTIAIPDDGTVVYCGTPLIGGMCPFEAHHAPEG